MQERPEGVVGSPGSHWFPELLPECGSSRCGILRYPELGAVWVAAGPGPLWQHLTAVPSMEGATGAMARGLHTASHLEILGRQSRRGGKMEAPV